jgi:hypothetical protein
MGGKKKPGYSMRFERDRDNKYQLWQKLIASWPAPKLIQEDIK